MGLNRRQGRRLGVQADENNGQQQEHHCREITPQFMHHLFSLLKWIITGGKDTNCSYIVTAKETLTHPLASIKAVAFIRNPRW
jgi:hypothetical protein